MKKETGIAIGLGIVFGLVFSFVIILNTQTNKSVSQKVQMDKSRPVTADTTQQNIVVQPIDIASPSDGAIFTSATAHLTGKAEKGSFIVIQTPSKDLTLTNDTEDFPADIPLSLGENVVHVSVYTKGTGIKVQEKELRVYYLPTT